MQKIAFHLGNYPIHWYGVLVALGFFIGLWTASRRAERYGLSREKVFDGGTWLIVGAIVGARALYVLSYWREDFAGAPFTEIFMVQRGGLVFYGGLIGSILAGILYARWAKIPVWKFGDAMAPSIALGYVPGRLGCLMNGCCFGRQTELPWAIHYPADHFTRGLPVHPSQIYDSLLNFILYMALAKFYRHRTFEGQVFATYLMAYAVTRSFVEFFRGDYPIHYLGGVATPAHLVSLVLFAAGLLLYVVLSRKRS